MTKTLNLGAWRRLLGDEGGHDLLLPAHHLVTHGVVTGMTGSGKTGLVTVLVEEALNAGIPTIVIDVKGDLPNLLLTFPKLEPEPLRRWLGRDLEDAGEEALRAACDKRSSALAEWSRGEAEVKSFCDRTALRVITPGSSAGEPLHVLEETDTRTAAHRNAALSGGHLQ